MVKGIFKDLDLFRKRIAKSTGLGFDLKMVPRQKNSILKLSKAYLLSPVLLFLKFL